MSEERAPAELVDRALTVGGVGRGGGPLSEVTRGIYARRAELAGQWRATALGLSAAIWTPEELAVYAAALVEQGYARSTAELAVRAIRWKHRVAGRPVPDGLPALYVLRGANPTAAAISVNDTPPPASREILAALAGATDPGNPVKAARDMAMLTLVYAGGLSDEQLVALDRSALSDELLVALDRGDGVRVGQVDAVVVRLPDRRVTLHHDADHDPAICPACCMFRWAGELSNRGLRAGPLFRSVDKAGNLAGLDRKGGTATADGALRARAVLRITRALAADAGLPWSVVRQPVRALRLRGALDAYAAGAPMTVVAARAGYAEGSAVLLRHLLNPEPGDQVAGDTREDS